MGATEVFFWFFGIGLRILGHSDRGCQLHYAKLEWRDDVDFLANTKREPHAKCSGTSNGHRAYIGIIYVWIIKWKAKRRGVYN